MDRTQRRRPTIAKEWQLVVLRKLQSESDNPTEQQRAAAAAETGLDEKWVRSWFVRQRAKLAARNRKHEPATTAPTFKLQLYYPSRRLVSTPSPSRSPRPSPPTEARDNPSTRVPHTAAIPMYSRDPLYNRYPDFSQFFRPQVHERFRTFEVPTAIHPDMNPHAPMGLLNPFYLGLPTHHSSTNIQPCPVSFSARLVDLLAHSSLPQYPIFPLPESGYLI
ncbi:hypothetical protein HD554DRAFT_2167143 [Boletus coccyginus]|nr:hypothetical protein HD554DRAFT_2167143 [Boletus coccyginus]